MNLDLMGQSASRWIGCRGAPFSDHNHVFAASRIWRPIAEDEADSLTRPLAIRFAGTAAISHSIAHSDICTGRSLCRHGGLLSGLLRFA